MSIIFHVITGNFLNGSNKNFSNIGDAIKHIQNIIDMRDDWVTDEQVRNSYSMTRLEFDEYEKEVYLKAFPDIEAVTAVEPPSNAELGIKPKRRPKIKANDVKEEEDSDTNEIDENKPI